MSPHQFYNGQLICFGCVYFLLVFRSISSMTTCNCIRLTACQSYMTQLRERTGASVALLQRIGNAGCGLEHVCCPFMDNRNDNGNANGKEQEPLRKVRIERSATASSEPWVWGRRPYTHVELQQHNSSPLQRSFESHPLGEHHETQSIFNTYLLNYKDPETKLNCPTTFYEASYIDDSYEQVVPTSRPSSFTNFDPRRRHHQRHQHTYEVYEHQSEEDDDDDNDDHQVEKNFGDEIKADTSEGPIIFPDNKRYKMFFTTTAAPVPIVKQKTTTKPTTTSSARPPEARDLINSSQCGISVTQRIIGGTDSVTRQFPWITRIAYLNRTNNRISYRCSGSVISRRYILTAAHCVVNLVSSLKLSHVRIGDDDNSSPSFAIAAVIVHPNYDQPKYANDIALLRIQWPQNATQRDFGTICLPVKSAGARDDILVGSTGVVAGWSTNSRGVETAVNSKVKYIRLPVVNTTECAITYAKYSEHFDDQIVITPSQLCAQGQPMNDVCRGDSGGPFMDDGSSGLLKSVGRYTLIGIVAFGPTTCGVSNFPGVYTRVSSFIDWIVDNIR